jgi:hypothetical protein
MFRIIVIDAAMMPIQRPSWMRPKTRVADSTTTTPQRIMTQPHARRFPYMSSLAWGAVL